MPPPQNARRRGGIYKGFSEEADEAKEAEEAKEAKEAEADARSPSCTKKCPLVDVWALLAGLQTEGCN